MHAACPHARLSFVFCPRESERCSLLTNHQSSFFGFLLTSFNRHCSSHVLHVEYCCRSRLQTNFVSCLHAATCAAVRCNNACSHLSTARGQGVRGGTALGCRPGVRASWLGLFSALWPAVRVQQRRARCSGAYQRRAGWLPLRLAGGALELPPGGKGALLRSLLVPCCPPQWALLVPKGCQGSDDRGTVPEEGGFSPGRPKKAPSAHFLRRCLRSTLNIRVLRGPWACSASRALSTTQPLYPTLSSWPRSPPRYAARQPPPVPGICRSAGLAGGHGRPRSWVAGMRCARGHARRPRPSLPARFRRIRHGTLRSGPRMPSARVERIPAAALWRALAVALAAAVLGGRPLAAAQPDCTGSQISCSGSVGSPTCCAKNGQRCDTDGTGQARCAACASTSCTTECLPGMACVRDHNGCYDCLQPCSDIEPCASFLVCAPAHPTVPGTYCRTNPCQEGAAWNPCTANSTRCRLTSTYTPQCLAGALGACRACLLRHLRAGSAPGVPSSLLALPWSSQHSSSQTVDLEPPRLPFLPRRRCGDLLGRTAVPGGPGLRGRHLRGRPLHWRHLP